MLRTLTNLSQALKFDVKMRTACYSKGVVPCAGCWSRVAAVFPRVFSVSPKRKIKQRTYRELQQPSAFGKGWNRGQRD